MDDFLRKKYEEIAFYKSMIESADTKEERDSWKRDVELAEIAIYEHTHDYDPHMRG